MLLDIDTHTLTVEEELSALGHEVEKLYRQNTDLRDENDALRQRLQMLATRGIQEKARISLTETSGRGVETCQS